MKRFLQTAVLLLLLSCAALAQAAAVPVKGGTVEILPAELAGENWLFLPAFADRAELYPAACETDETGVWYDETAQMYIMQGQNLRALFLFSDDPVNEGRLFIENCLGHENQTTGSMAIVDADGTVDHADDLRQLRGRGNGTWVHSKRPYQFKLENRADLLRTGDQDERARTWVLLAEATDGTMLHNKLALDLGLELGMVNTSHSEFVDLYYDGEYRGVYLLAEKVEMDEARISERNYDDLLEAWNKSIGQNDLEALEVRQGQNRFGNVFAYIEGVADNGLVDAGAYMLEMESPNGDTLSERCYFTTGDGNTIAFKSPENPSEAMARYASERLTEARQTLQNGGVHPESGRTIEEDFNVDAFARLALINELAGNLDGFWWSSTFFVLPAGETRFEPGPAWDFDLAWRYRMDGSMQDGRGLKMRDGWLAEFYSCKSFAACAKEIYLNELYPLVQNVLLGGENGRWLQPLESYVHHIEASRRMNERLWSVVKDSRLQYGENHEEEIALLRQFIGQRSEWLHSEMTTVPEREISLTLRVPYGYADSRLDFWLTPWSGAALREYTSEILSEATEEDYAVYEVEAFFVRKDGEAFEEAASARINGCELAGEVQTDGSLRICFSFEDRTYRPVDYYGEDIGMVYDYEFYISRYPEVIEEVGDDPQDVMDYFCDEGMYEGHQANVFFAPTQILLYNPRLEDILGEDWWNYYWEFLYYGFDDGWLIPMNQTYSPPVEDLL